MTEILTESFCERCGTRYTFELTGRRWGSVTRLRVLSRGLRNLVMTDGLSVADAMATARIDEERAASNEQLDAFHRTFNFCFSCRQYTCANCWNEPEGKCLTCAPDLAREILPAAFPDLPAHGLVPAAPDNGRAPIEAWPTIDLPRPVQAATPTVTEVEAIEAAAAPVAEPIAAEPTPAPPAAVEAIEPAAAPVAEPIAVEPTPAPPAAVEPAPVAEPIAVEPTPAPPAAVAGTEPTAVEAIEPAAAPVAELTAAEPAAAPPAAPEPAAAPIVTEIEPAPEGLTRDELAAVEGALVARSASAATVAPAVQRPAAEPAGTPAPAAAIEPLAAARADPLAAGRAQTASLLHRFRPARSRQPAAVGRPAPATGTPTPPGPATAATPPASGTATTPAVAAAPVVPPGPVAPTVPVVRGVPVDAIPQPTWRMVAPETTDTIAPDTDQLPSVKSPVVPGRFLGARPAPRPGGSPAAPWAARLASARPVVGGVWAESSRDVLGPAGTAAAAGVQACVSCGLPLSANARFCRRCGSRQD